MMPYFSDLRSFQRCGSFLRRTACTAGWVPIAATLALITITPILSGCAGSPQTRFYSLEPVPPIAVATALYAGPPIQLRVVHVPPAMDRMEILHELTPGQSQVRESDHWAAPLGQVARQTLTEDLLARLPANAVVFPNMPKPGQAVELSVDILSFRAGDGTAVMDVSWSLGAPLATASAPRSTHQLQLHTPASGDGASVTAQAFSALLAQLADRITAALAQPGS